MLFRLMGQQQLLSLGTVTACPLLIKIPSVSAPKQSPEEFVSMVPWASCSTNKPRLALRTAFRWAALLYELITAG